MKKLLAVAVMFSLASAAVTVSGTCGASGTDPAASAEVNFDRGVNFPEFVKNISENAQSQSCSPLPVIKADFIENSDLRIECVSPFGGKSSKPGAGYICGPHHPRILDSQIYKNGAVYPPFLQQEENQMAYQLLADWNYLGSVRENLLNEAYALNTKDSGLYSEGVQLNNEAESFKREIAQFNANVNAYNQQCAGQPFNWYCYDWYNNIEKWRADLTRRLNVHYDKAEKWRVRRDELYDLIDEILVKIMGWENRINDFISDAKALLNKGNCTYEQWKPLYDTVKRACNGGHCSSEQNCDTLKSNLAINQSCYNARVKIRDVCYTNVPDPGDHEQAINDAQKAIKNCLSFMEQQHCGGVGCLDTLPVRRYAGE